MKTKENQRVALTKRLLKETLLVLMEEKNIQNITIVELCNMAEINRSTFYNHYGCPADVLLDIENSVVNDLDEIWTKEDETEKNLALVNALKHYVSIYLNIVNCSSFYFVTMILLLILLFY